METNMASLALFNALAAFNVPFHPFRVTYEIKTRNSYSVLYDYIFSRKAYQRVDDCSYFFLEWQEDRVVHSQLVKCVTPNDRISLEPLHQNIEMLAYNMPKVIDWLEQYVTGPHAAANRGYHAKPVLPLGSNLGNALLASAPRRIGALARNSLLGRPVKR